MPQTCVCVCVFTRLSDKGQQFPSMVEKPSAVKTIRSGSELTFRKSCEHISLFWTRRLEQLRVVRSRPCVLAEPRRGERTGRVTLLGKCERGFEGSCKPRTWPTFGIVPMKKKKKKDSKNVGDRRRCGSSPSGPRSWPGCDIGPLLVLAVAHIWNELNLHPDKSPLPPADVTFEFLQFLSCSQGQTAATRQGGISL